MSEVNVVPGVSHQLKIPEGATFQTKIGQHSMTPPQQKYLNEKVDEMLAAGIIALIHQYFTLPHLSYWTPIGLLELHLDSEWSPIGLSLLYWTLL
jgi:hypothetical protein